MMKRPPNALAWPRATDGVAPGSARHARFRLRMYVHSESLSFGDKHEKKAVRFEYIILVFETTPYKHPTAVVVPRTKRSEDTTRRRRGRLAREPRLTSPSARSNRSAITPDRSLCEASAMSAPAAELINSAEKVAMQLMYMTTVVCYFRAEILIGELWAVSAGGGPARCPQGAGAGWASARPA